MVALNKPGAGNTDWTTLVNDNWTTIEDAFNTLKTAATTPAQLSGNQNDYNPGSTGNFFRLSSSVAVTITGLAGGSDGRLMFLVNVGSNNIVLSNQDAASAAANRIITATGASVTLGADETALLIYDSTTSRWRVIGKWVITGGGSESAANNVLRYERFY